MGNSRGGEHRPHHISTIAHLFFAENDDESGGNGPACVLDFAVAGLNGCRISAFASAALVASARELSTAEIGWDISLRENEHVTWSARAFLPSEDSPETGANGGNVCWRWPANREAQRPSGQMRWTHFDAGTNDRLGLLEDLEGARLAVGGGWTEATPGSADLGLVLCLLESEMVRWGAALQVGRLLGVVAPRLLEILVFDDSWGLDIGGRRGGWRPFERFGNSVPTHPDCCDDLLRTVAGTCPVTITAVPPTGSEGKNTALESLFLPVVSRLVATAGVGLAAPSGSDFSGAETF